MKKVWGNKHPVGTWMLRCLKEIEERVRSGTGKSEWQKRRTGFLIRRGIKVE